MDDRDAVGQGASASPSGTAHARSNDALPTIVDDPVTCAIDGDLVQPSPATALPPGGALPVLAPFR